VNWTREILLAALERVGARVHRTPVLSAMTINESCGARLYFKCENFQKTGSFKARGATHALLRLIEDGPVPGVCTHSSGNFAAALAYAARQMGLPAAIVMPRNAPVVKKQAVRAYGGSICECEPTLAARQVALEQLVRDTGYAPLHPYDHPWVIAGQATAAMELLQEVPDLDWLVAPVGGGGLVSGTALAARFFGSGARVAAAEPAGADDAYRSKQAGHVIPQTDPHTMADGLLTSLGQHTFPVIRDYVDRILLVQEEEIVEAMRQLFTRMKIVVEPSAAVAFAAVMKSRDLFEGTRTGVILSGGNVDPDRLPFGHAGRPS
jgi:threonine dehydratase